MLTCKVSPILGPFFWGVLRHRLRQPSMVSLVSRRRLLLKGSQAYSLAPFSTRSGRESRGSGFRMDARSGSSKSLIDDEAELSDWVSGLSSKKKGRLYSDSEGDENGDSGNGGLRGREAGGKRRRDNAMDGGFDSRSKRRGGNQDVFLGNRKGVDRENGDYDRRGNFEGRFGEKRGRSPGFMNRDNRGRGEGRQTERRFEFEDGKVRMGDQGGSKLRSYDDNGFMSRGNRRMGEGRQIERRSEYMDGRGRNGGQGGSKFRTYEKSTPKRGFLDVDNDDGTEEEEEEEEKSNLYKNFKKLIQSDEDEDDGSDEHDKEEEELPNRLSKEEAFPQKSTGSESYLSESRFDECPISPLSLKALRDAGYEKMTLVQEATLPVILKGKDVLAKAKTGTGKTVAFLLPAIEVVVKLPQAAQSEKRPPILVLVICPTRELACQAAAEANKLLKYHPSIGTQVVIGGTRLALEQKRMQANPCQILVATPGRLRDHIENTAGFATRLMGVKVLVLDEADHLLGLGFRKEIERIVDAVPKQRQTLLFSATVPPEVRQISHIALRRDHEFINTVKEGSEDTHSQVRQTHLVANSDNHFSLLYSLLKEHMADDVHYKVLVFCTTAMVTKLVAELLRELNLNVREIHSRKSQTYRTKVSDEFRKSTGLILVTSDVSARGVDYPDVTLVVQMGLPADKQQYIHRLGRTGRKGKEGQGILLLAPWEEFFLSSIKDLPLSKASVPIVDQDTRKKVDRALSHVELRSKEAAYQAWLGYYNSNSHVGRDKFRLVELANEFSRCMGLDNPPAIPKLVLGKMGLKNVPGLRSK